MKTEAGYPQEKQALDAALLNGGAEITFHSHGVAVRFRQTCYEYRKLMRTRGITTYDALTMPKIPPGERVLRIVPAASAVEMVIRPTGKGPVGIPQTHDDDDGLLDAAKAVKKGLDLDL